ncbi:hypothetical protein ACPC54_12145 [Kitasatospora sp. NPDC094028]
MPTDEPGGPPPDELAALRARLSAVEARTGPAGRHPGRTVLATVLILPACLLTPLGAWISGGGRWARAVRGGRPEPSTGRPGLSTGLWTTRPSGGQSSWKSPAVCSVAYSADSRAFQLA